MQRYERALMDRPTLHTARLLLRRPAEADVPAIVAIAGDWEVASRLARMPHPYGEADARFFLDVVVPAELVWAVVEKASGYMVGAVGLASKEQAPGAVELGYYVCRAHWGRGVATEAGSAAVAYGVGLFGAERLRSGYFADNPASGRVLEKLGFGVVGRSERPCLAAGRSKLSLEMALGA